MSTMNKTSTGFWVIAIIATIWNIMGVFQYLSFTYLKDEMTATMTDPEIALVDGLPSWYIGVFAIAVFTGLIASLLLLLRKKWATSIFLISMIAIIIQMGYWLFVTGAMDVYGSEAFLMPIIVIIIGVFLYLYSKKATQKGILK